MHTTTWRVLRSTSRCPFPARFIAGRRHVLSSRHRGFRNLAPLAQKSTPPAGSPSNQPNDVASPDLTNPADPPLPPPKEGGQDAEALYSKKLNEARGAARRYGSALRRAQRRKHEEGMPPVHFPKWFLDRNVTLSEEAVLEPWGPCLECEVLVKDRESGTVLHRFLFPCEPSRLQQMVEEVCKSFQREELGNEYVKRLEEAGLLSKEDVQHLDPETTNTEKYNEGPSSQLLDVGREVQERLVAKDTELHSTLDQAPSDTRHGNANLQNQIPSSAKVNPWTLAEVKATIAGCLAGIGSEHELSHAAARTNLLLHGHADRGEKGESHLMAYDFILRQVVEDAARELNADLIRVDAQDLAELMGDYVGEGQTSEESIRNIPFEAFRERTRSEPMEEELGEEGDENVEDIVPTNANTTFIVPGMSSQSALGSPLRNIANALAAGLSRPGVGGKGAFATATSDRSDVSSTATQYEDMKIAAWIEALLNVRSRISEGRPNPATAAQNNATEAESQTFKNQMKLDLSFVASDDPKLASIDQDTTSPVAVSVGSNSEDSHATSGLDISLNVRKERDATKNAKPEVSRTIVLVENLTDIGATAYGGRIIDRLQDAVRKRKAEGEQIVLVGTESSEITIDGPSDKKRIVSIQEEGATVDSRTILVRLETSYPKTKYPPLFEIHHMFDQSRPPKSRDEEMERQGVARMNLRNIQAVLRQLCPTAVDVTDPTEPLRLPFNPPNSLSFDKRILGFDEIHRIALAAVGIHKSQPDSTQLQPIHINLAMAVIHYSDEYKFLWTDPILATAMKGGAAPVPKKAKKPTVEARLEKIGKDANQYEKRLMHGVINPANIKTTYQDIHVPADTINAVQILTTLSLLHPQAFRYGILSREKIPGLLLYGPPGTGKTLIAKAVAQDNSAVVLEVSGSEIYDKYVGEGEKNVRAVFSLARKLSPCVVFIDEADAILGSRSGASGRKSHREIINQFLKEWDGLNDHGVFIMVATNRPFDLDDAVLRRLPRRVLVDLPTQEDREKILAIHLKGETLDDAVSLSDIAAQTPLYSGSDLKNVCVAAALNCVKEELVTRRRLIEEDLKKQQDASPDVPRSELVKPDIPYPARRVLRKAHFDKALQEIGASISEDMGSLNAIRKFDEQFGDRGAKGRKKTRWGFMTLDEDTASKADERSARVRQ